jgi:23S rRNA U2552 (ribose-2'-O)-methylase RlmE/FtsJ
MSEFIIKTNNILKRVHFHGEDNEVVLGWDLNLNTVKDKINNINISDWNKIRKVTNEYEFPLHLVNLDNDMHTKIISRAFFKMWDIINKYGILDIEKKINVMNIAEAPGGFVQAINYYRKKKYSIDDNYNIITLLSSKNDVPKLSNLVKKIPNMSIYKQRNGDIYNIDNILDVSNNTLKKDIITADGSFNEDKQYNLKEALHHKLIRNEIILAILNQKEGGCFILKIFDI